MRERPRAGAGSVAGMSAIGDLSDRARLGFGQTPRLVLCGQLWHMVCDLPTHTTLKGSLFLNDLKRRNLIEQNQNYPWVNCTQIANAV